MVEPFPGVTPKAVTEVMAALVRELRSDTDRLLAIAQRLRADNRALAQENREQLATLTASIQRFRAWIPACIPELN